MTDNKRPLYIPIKTLDSDDFIEGIGPFEVAVIGAGTVIGLLLGIIVSNVINNNIAGVMIGCITVALTIGIFRRDGTNENLIRKCGVIFRFVKVQKRYMYRFYNILEDMNISGEDDEMGGELDE